MVNAAKVALIESGLASELAMTDVDLRRAEDEMMDLNHALPFEHNCQIRASDY